CRVGAPPRTPGRAQAQPADRDQPAALSRREDARQARRVRALARESARVARRARGLRVLAHGMTTHAAMRRFFRRNAELWIVFAVLAMVPGCASLPSLEGRKETVAM